MIVKKIELINFKRIEAFEAEISNGVYLITGKNEMGKSTLIQAITMMLTADRSYNLLRKGTDKGSVKIIVGDENTNYEAELKFSEKNPRGTLTIKRDGDLASSDKVTVLQQLFNYTDFDVNEFLNWSKSTEGRRKQIDIVMGLFPDKERARFAELTNLILTNKTSRTDINRDVTFLESKIQTGGMSTIEIQKYKKPIDTEELEEEISKYKEEGTAFVKGEALLESLNKELDNFDASVDELEKEKLSAIKDKDFEIMRVEKELSSLKTASKDMSNLLTVFRGDKEKEKKKLETRIETGNNTVNSLKKSAEKLSVAEAEKETADEFNENHEKYLAFITSKKSFDNRVKDQVKINTQINNYEAEKVKILSSNIMPVEGLTISEDGLRLNNIPFAPGEVSTSQMMEVATKIIIAKNPTVKVFKILQGESLDSDKMKSLVKFANDNGYQGFIEVVRGGELTLEEYTEAE